MPATERASGYFQYFDPVTGICQEGETRTCVHCGFTWIYDPKLQIRRKLGLWTPQPKIRGTCLKCSGLVCARDECLKRDCVPVMKQIDEMEKKSALILRG